MFEPIRIADRFVAHPRHSPSYGCGSLRGLVARTRLSACTQNLWGEVQASSPASCDQRPTSAGNSSRDLIKASGRGPCRSSGDRLRFTQKLVNPKALPPATSQPLDDTKPIRMGKSFRWSTASWYTRGLGLYTSTES